MAGNNSIQFLRGTSTQRNSNANTSLIGQPLFETDTNMLYIGDNSTAINNLQPLFSDYYATKEYVDNAFGNMIVMEDNGDGTVTMNIKSSAIEVSTSGNTINITL